MRSRRYDEGTPPHKKNGDLSGAFNVFGGVSETYVGCGERGKAHGSLWGNHLDHALQRLHILSPNPVSGPRRSGVWQRFWSLGQASNLLLQYVRPENVFGGTWSFNSRKEGWFAYASECEPAP